MKAMKSKKHEAIILNDEDLSAWGERVVASFSYKKKIIIKIKKSFDACMEYFFRGVGLYFRGYQNALDLQVRHVEFAFPDFPSEFHGIRILFLSDLHLGRIRELPDIIVEKMRGLRFDLCLFGGDYRLSFAHPGRPFLADLEKIVSRIHAPLGIYGVLGNHDELEFIPALEKMNMKILLNSSVSIERGGQKICLAGVDEIFARRHDLKKAFEDVPRNAFCVFLGHSPDLYREVEDYGAKLYLCGHTHHGQIRLPWIGPILTNTGAPRGFATGQWQYKRVSGYTGAGAGSGGPLVRFLCPPEISVVTLKKIS